MEEEKDYEVTIKSNDDCFITKMKLTKLQYKDFILWLFKRRKQKNEGK